MNFDDSVIENLAGFLLPNKIPSKPSKSSKVLNFLESEKIIKETNLPMENNAINDNGIYMGHRKIKYPTNSSLKLNLKIKSPMIIHKDIKEKCINNHERNSEEGFIGLYRRRRYSAIEIQLKNCKVQEKIPEIKEPK